MHSSLANASGRRVYGPQNTIRQAFYGSHRPPARSSLGSLSGRRNSYWASTSRFSSNRNQSNFGHSFGNSRFGGSNFANASFSRSGPSRFGSNGFDGFGRFGGSFNRFDRFDHFGYGYGDGGGADFWFLGDLFGLALDFTRFAVFPPFGYLGWNVLDLGLQALNSDFGGDNGYGSYDNGNYQQQAYAPLCPEYYSDENPGCAQQF
jgi:hypothetical protein